MLVEKHNVIDDPIYTVHKDVDPIIGGRNGLFVRTFGSDMHFAILTRPVMVSIVRGSSNCRIAPKAQLSEPFVQYWSLLPQTGRV